MPSRCYFQPTAQSFRERLWLRPESLQIAKTLNHARDVLRGLKWLPGELGVLL